MLGSNNLLSRPSIEINTAWAFNWEKATILFITKTSATELHYKIVKAAYSRTIEETDKRRQF